MTVVDIYMDNENTIELGNEGEYGVRQVVFHLESLISQYGQGVAILWYARNGDDFVHPAETVQEGDTLTWDITQFDTARAGAGAVCLLWFDAADTDRLLKKSSVWRTRVRDSAGQVSADEPYSYNSWVYKLTKLGAKTLANAQAAEQSAQDARDAAEGIEDKVGDLDDLVTEEKDTLVGAVNEVAEEVGNLDVNAEKVGKTVTLTITMRDGTEKQVTVSDGVSIVSVTKTSSSGLVDTYTIAFDNGTSTTFTVTNGEDGEGAVSDEIKEALLGCFENVAWANANGQTYYNTLVKALDGGKTLASISAAYTGGEVEEGSPLTELTGITVTAHYAGGTTHVLTGGYALSGSIAIGENTITVTYRDKTTTFTVTGIPYDSSPEILAYDKAWDTSGSAADKTGACVTEYYEFTPDIEAFKETQYWDEANGYATQEGSLYKIKYLTPNTAGVAFSSLGKFAERSMSDELTSYWSPTRSADTEQTIGNKRYKENICIAGNYPLKISFTLTTENAADSYAYWVPASFTGLLPVGVRDGDIIFAGENTPYYGMHNIHDAE